MFRRGTGDETGRPLILLLNIYKTAPCTDALYSKISLRIIPFFHDDVR
jgi:hypothetical protein